MSHYPTPAAARHTAITPLNLAKLTALFRGRSIATVVDAIWVPAVAATLIVLAGAVGYWLKQPWLFAGLGPTVLMLASNPGHETTRFRAVVVAHLAAIGVAYLALLLLNANVATAVITRATVPLPRVWASAASLAMLAILMPQLRAYHPPAARDCAPRHPRGVSHDWQDSAGADGRCSGRRRGCRAAAPRPSP